MISKFIKVIISFVLVGVVFTGCSTKKADNEALSSNSSKSEVKKVLVGTEGTFKPYTYKDKEGNLTGYDVEVIKEIDKRIDELEFDFVTAPWDSIFLGLDSNKYQIIANNITKKPEREEKYLFTKDFYFINKTVLIVKEGREDIKSIEDLKGKKVPIAAGTATYLYLEKFNKENKDNPIKLINVEADPAATLQGVATGKYDASIYESVIVDEVKSNFNLKLKTITLPNEQEIQKSEAYFLFRKDQGDIKSKVDKALEELIKDGTLSKLSTKFFKADYSK